MYHVLQLTYTQPIDVVDGVRPAHLEWLDAEIAAGNILISGRNEAGPAAC
ncbi:GTP cyclohydrolase II [Mycobacteroides abscessus]|nr:GTP cyclohydrolase II [Mycobacteroides abscessus]